MKSTIKKASLFFIIMVAMLMMSMTYAAEDTLFELDNVPKTVTIHLNQWGVLPTEEPEGEYGGWEVVSGGNRLKMHFGYEMEALKTGTAKVALETKAGEEHIVSIKIVNHKYDKTTNKCSCGVRRPISSMKFKETSFAFSQDDTTLEMSKYLNVKPANLASDVIWYSHALSSWYGGSIASINQATGELSINRRNMGTGRVRAVDSASGKEVSVPFAVFDKELLEQYNLCLGESIVLPMAEKGATWEIVSGDNRVEDTYENGIQFKGIKKGTAKLVYETEAGEFTTKIKVGNHKFNKKTGECNYCGAKQPPKTMKFTESTFRFAYFTDENIELADSKYISVNPEGAIDELEWEIDTIQSWYASTEIAEVDENGDLELTDWGVGKLYAIHPESGKEIEANIVVSDYPIPEELELHVGQTIWLGVVEHYAKYSIVKGDTKVEIDNEGQPSVTGLAKGTATLVYPTKIGDLTVKVKVSNHKYDKKTGVCSCGAKQPPKKFEFNESTYVLTKGEYDLASSKYFNLQPTNANVNMNWYLSTISSWYAGPMATLTSDGILEIPNYCTGYGKVLVTDRISGANDLLEIIIDTKTLEEQYTIHVGERLRLPTAGNETKWEVTSGSKYVKAVSSIRFEALAKGTAKLKYTTPAGNILTTTVKVLNHKYDSNGICECGAEKISISQDIIDILEEYDIMTCYPDGSFRAQNTLNRAEVAKTLVLALNLVEDAEEMENEILFTDESLQDDGAFEWARGYINLAIEKGIMTGYPNGTFKPEKEVTIEEFLKMVVITLGYENTVTEGTWPTNYIMKCKELELLDGVEYEDSSDKLTRGVAATVLYNALYTPMWVKTGTATWKQGPTLEQHAFTGVYDFYVMTGKYAWYETSRNGLIYYYDLSNVEGENTYTFTEELYEELGLGAYEDESSYVELTQDMENGLLEEALLERIFAATLNSNDELSFEEYNYEKNFSEIYEVDVRDDNEENILDEDNYFIGWDNYKVTSSTVVYKISAIIENGEVIGIKVETSNGDDALEEVKYAKFVTAIDRNGEEAKNVSYVFVAASPDSANLNFGLVERVRTSRGINYITISGEEYEITDESNVPEVDDLVAYTLNAEVATISEIIKPTDVDDETIPMVEKVEDGIIYLSDDIMLDTDRNVTREEYENTTFVLTAVDLDANNVVEFDAEVEVLGKGIENVTFKKR